MHVGLLDGPEPTKASASQMIEAHDRAAADTGT